MFGAPKIVTRIAIGKSIGLLVGLTGFFILPEINPETDGMLKWGFLFWYITFGAFIGIVGLFDRHPILKFPMPWWLRAPLLGAWLNLVLTMVAYEKLQQIMLVVMGSDSTFTSPFWFVLEGAAIGLLIGFFATRYGGEGFQTTRA